MNLRRAFAEQGTACAALGSPFMGRLMALLSENWPEDSALARKFNGFKGDIGPGGASLPLRLAGGLHALVLLGLDPALRDVYPPATVSDRRLWAEVARALSEHAGFLDHWTDSAPQTNEVRRSAVLIAVGRTLAARFALPLRLSELGASAGLNLLWDRIALDIRGASFAPSDPILRLAPDWDGPLLPDAAIRVADRRGTDLNPLDPHEPGDALRLLAYLWPDQPERLSRTRAAMAAAGGDVDRADAADWLATRLSASAPGQTHLIFHTVAWQYFPLDVQARARSLIEAAGQWASETAPLAWFWMENDGGSAPGAALILRLWPGDLRFDLGRADFHGRWVRWRGL